jgi:ABC-type thiamin/hydroxymethylpyrimidine transport system permease subunit
MQALSGIHFWRQYSFLSDHTSSFGLTAGAFIQTYIYGRMLSTHEALLIFFHQPVSQPLLVVLSHIFPLQS